MKTFILRTPEIAERACAMIRQLVGERVYQVTISEYRSKRSLEQNDKMWAMLTDISRQVDWYGHRLTPEEWKDVLTAALKGQKAVPGINGGFVILGARTSKMSIAEMSDVIELAYAFGAEKGVKWKAPEE